MSDKINLGCGTLLLDGYDNVDIKGGYSVIKRDLEKVPYDFPLNHYTRVVMKEVLEHLKNPVEVLREVRKIMIVDGLCSITCPHFTSSNLYNDITHYKGYSWDALNYLRDEGFEIVSKEISFGKRYQLWNYLIEVIANKFPKLYEDTPLRIFPALNMIYVLRKMP